MTTPTNNDIRRASECVIKGCTREEFRFGKVKIARVEINIAQALADERERCAKIVEMMYENNRGDIAAAIRKGEV